MITTEFADALATVAHSLSGHPTLAALVQAHWDFGDSDATGLTGALRAAVDTVHARLTNLVSNDANALPDALDTLLAPGHDEVVLSWCSAVAWRDDMALTPLLAAAASQPTRNIREAASAAARSRVVNGPLRDALSAAPLMSEFDPDDAEVRSRLEILIWEAGARSLEVPAFGKWIWSQPAIFEALIGTPASSALRGRVLAASCLEISVGAMDQNTAPGLFDRTLQVLQPLLLHPEPMVWIRAARALGRLIGPMEQLQGMLLDWVMGDSPVLRQRAITAFASVPVERLGFLKGQLVAIVASPDEDAWVLAALAAATPYLYLEQRATWERLAQRILSGEGGAITARALARGLASLWRRGTLNEELDAPLRQLRTRARRMNANDFSDTRRWSEVVAVTDVIDGAERDPLDLELGLDNLVRLAAQYDDPVADARAARFAESLSTTFQEAKRIALGNRRLRQQASAINALEACARVFALRLWHPLLATSPGHEPIEEPALGETWQIVASTPAEILELVEERRQLEESDTETDVPLEALALRLGGYALDACGEDTSLGPGSGPTAHDTCLWLRKLHGLVDGSRELPPAIETALSALFWRLVDTTRGTTLGETDDVAWLGPFAAWWALVIDRPAVLQRLATALPMMETRALDHCCTQAETLRAAMSADRGDGAWGPAASAALQSLQAHDTELSHALGSLARSLQSLATASGMLPDLETRCVELVMAGERVHAALADPVKALHNTATSEPFEDSLTRDATQNAPRRAALMARAIRSRDLSLMEVWLASLGPIASALIESAIQGAIKRTPPPPPHKRKDKPKVIHGYELIQTIGEGGIGSVWLVRKPGADRLFVLKIPKAEALATANEVETEGILASFVEEAAALAALYHPNVANIIDRGVAEGVPFLVLDYLIGADLKQYSEARPMSLFELRPVVMGACAGLEALHGAGLVHRDIKPGNLFLRLPLDKGERFDPHKHRDPAITPPLATVIIDFGMVRSQRVSDEAAGRFVAGTAGYIAPEQVLDPVHLHPHADVYSLAATIYKVATGRTFFDEIEDPRQRIMAHMKNDPFDDARRLKPFPRAVRKIMKAATARKPEDRPNPLEFGRAFADAI